MIIYIHGFGSSGFGGKAEKLKEYFDDDIILPSLSYVPILAINTLEQIIEVIQARNEIVYLIGSSLGGYYAMYLSDKYNLKAVLINPAIYPYKTLDKIGLATNYYDLSSFEVTSTHIESLKKLEIKSFKNESNFMLLLQTDDEVLNYLDAVDKLSNANLNIEEGGSHSFEDIPKYFRKINDFFYK